MARGLVPYCTPRMLRTLALYVGGRIPWNVDRNTYEALRARGWIRDGMPTDAGRAYLERNNKK